MSADSRTEEFYVTFGQKYRREEHPIWGHIHPDGYLTVVAADYDEARGAVYQVLGIAWGFLYDATAFASSRGLYTLGELGRIIAADLPAVA